MSLIKASNAPAVMDKKEFLPVILVRVLKKPHGLLVASK
jgi:hypothetical protein